MWFQFSSVQSPSRVRLFATPWIAARQASLSITNSWSLLMSIESVMPSNYLILCCPLLLLPSTFPSIRVFSNVVYSHFYKWLHNRQNSCYRNASRSTSTTHCADSPSVTARSQKDINVSLYEGILQHLALKLSIEKHSLICTEPEVNI